MEITGKLFDILEAQTGTSARGEWKKQDFVIETEEQYPKKVCISNWNDKVDINSLNKGDVITLSVNLESREFNGKWYTDVKVWKLEKTAQNTGVAQSGNDVPPPPPTVDDMAWNENDDDDVNDLPF